MYELAVHEKLEQFARATPDDFRHHLFGPRPYAEAIVAEIDGEPAGFALFFPMFSSFRGQPGLYLEDVYVRPVHRGRGIGKALLAKLAKLAMDRGLGRLEWAVLNWNSPAIGFYRGLGRAAAGGLDDLSDQRRPTCRAGRTGTVGVNRTTLAWSGSQE